STVIPLDGRWSYRPGPDLKDFPARDPKLDANPSPTAPRYSPTVLFNGMIDPLVRMRLKGVIWYQGEENAIDHRSAQYRRLFPALIDDWRAHFGYEFPFLYVQLAGGFANESQPAEYPWAELREAQTQALSLPLTGMATAVDVSEEGNPHPR